MDLRLFYFHVTRCHSFKTSSYLTICSKFSKVLLRHVFSWYPCPTPFMRFPLLVEVVHTASNSAKEYSLNHKNRFTSLSSFAFCLASSSSFCFFSLVMATLSRSSHSSCSFALIRNLRQVLIRSSKRKTQESLTF